MSNDKKPDPTTHSEGQARAQYESIVDYIAALGCDYDRLEELREQRDNSDTYEPAGRDSNLSDAEARELADLETAAGECESEDDARQRIEEDALEIQVRSDWHTPGNAHQRDNDPIEFYILLCTGGPAVRIIGELQNGEPHRARLEHQDWGTSWTELRAWKNEAGEDCRVDTDVLLRYASVFYFGEE